METINASTGTDTMRPTTIATAKLTGDMIAPSLRRRGWSPQGDFLDAFIPPEYFIAAHAEELRRARVRYVARTPNGLRRQRCTRVDARQILLAFGEATRFEGGRERNAL